MLNKLKSSCFSSINVCELQLQGFAELEYGMLRYMGAIDDSTMIVTTGEFSLLILLVACFLHGSDLFSGSVRLIHRIYSYLTVLELE